VKRLRPISWDELRIRGWQELGKRWDLMQYWLGFTRRPLSNSLPAGSDASARFFFSSAELVPLIAELARRFPSEAAATIRSAEQICKHEFDLLGFERVSYGPTIDWHLDAVHGKTALRKPWFRVRYLNFNEVGDSKITWELNRHQHLVTLAKAYRLTGREEFAKELFNQWFDWQHQNPYPIGINWASSLEVAFRTISWLWIWNLLADTPVAPSTFYPNLVQQLSVSGRHIEKYLSTYFSPNTHLLGEGVALFFLGTLCPSLPRARRWQQTGWNTILEAAKRQVRSDGMHFEQSTYYHIYALDFFLHGRILAAVNGLHIPEEFDQTIERMMDFLATVAQTGVPPSLGDDDGGRIFDPRRNRAEHLLDPLATGAALFTRPDWKRVAVGAREETLWLLGLQGLDNFDSLANESYTPRSTAFVESGIYVMADAVPVRARLVIDAGPHGSLSGGHGHADALSIQVSAEGRELLLDPGTCCYVSEDQSRNEFRGTAAHNTLRVGRLDQAKPNGPFSWEAFVDTKVESWITGSAFELFRGSHSGYVRLPQPVLHRRWVFHLKSQFWLVRDVALGEGEKALDVFWHIAPGFLPRRESSGTILLEDPAGPRFALLTDECSGWTATIEDGWWSPVYGIRESAPVLHFQRQSMLPAECYSLLLLEHNATEALGRFVSTKKDSSSVSVSACTYEIDSQTHEMIFSEGKENWQAGTIESDAQFLYLLFDADKQVRRFILCGGSFIKLSGRLIFATEHAVSFHEWDATVDQPRLELFPGVDDGGSGPTKPHPLEIID
jgi:Heparinase II/III-like protein/Heparinase II/III N-terminus